MLIDEALAVVKAAGYRVTKPRAKLNGHAFGLNAIGKPYSPQYDPKYRMKYHTPKLKRQQNIGNAVSPERWIVMCREAQKEWDAKMKAVQS